MGRTEECLKKYGAALSYYQKYDSLVPGNTEIVNKIGDLRYKQDLQAKQDQARLLTTVAWTK
jgi:hypothetical protein